MTLLPRNSLAESLLTRPTAIRKMLDGVKTSERRNRRHADEGDTFEIEGRRFVVSEVRQQQLGEMTDADARSEGVADMAAYQAFIQSAHPGMPWLPKAKVWVHTWQEIKG